MKGMVAGHFEVFVGTSHIPEALNHVVDHGVRHVTLVEFLSGSFCSNNTIWDFGLHI
jgi:hypothetical protein